MRIHRMTLKQETNGLKSINMFGLDDVVILAGPNGSGKTRLFNLMSQEIPKGSADILQCEFMESTDPQEIRIADYSHYDAKLQLPEDFPPYVIASAGERLKTCNFENTLNDALLYIKSLVLYHEEKLPDLNKYLTVFLGEGIVLGNNNIPTIFGLDFSRMQLSPGQQYLLRMCVALYCNDTAKAPILLLDEPEVHLHPKVLLDVIKKIQEIFCNTQIWIATHSIAVLSMFDAVKIWYIDDGSVRRIGSNSEAILNGLLGGDDARINLQQFIVTPDVFAANRFAYESLFNPSVLSNFGNDDPQAKLIADSLEKMKGKEKIIFVDYGAGKGRMVEALYNEEKFKLLDYYAYDVSDEYKDMCIDVMKNCGKEEGKYFNDLSRMIESISEGADIVALVNVLHEIEPCKWTEVLNESIGNLLSENGILVVVENERLTWGEKPYTNGFLVHNETSMEELLDGIHIYPLRFPKKETLSAYLIPKLALLKITPESVEASVHAIRNEALDQIRRLRVESELEKPTYAKGIEHAFWVNQYANASLHLDGESS